MDEKWDEVLSLAEKYGFVIMAYGGSAVLATHENQLEKYGLEEYENIQIRNRGEEARQ